MSAQPEGGNFRWHAGAWFGTQTGCSLWLLIGSVFLFSSAPRMAAVWLGGFVLCNIVGLFLWTSRERLTAHAAYQWLLLLQGVIALLSIATAHRSGVLQSLTHGAGALAAYAALLVFPSLMLRIYLRERSSRQAGS